MEIKRIILDALLATKAFMITGCLAYLFAFMYFTLLCIQKNWTSKVLGILLMLTGKFHCEKRCL